VPHLDLDVPLFQVMDIDCSDSPRKMISLRDLIANYTKPEYVVIAPADLLDFERHHPAERKFSNNSHNLRAELKNFE
jgi:NRPS condensation-like uncharacterized protein